MSNQITVRKSGIVDVDSGKNVVIYEPVNLYGCILEDDVFIGPFVEIQKNTRIGQGTKIQSHCFICEYVVIGNNCFIGHNVTFVNDLFKNGYPDSDRANWQHTVLHDGVSIGSGSTLLAVEICAGTVIGAGSVVTKNITVKGVYAGNPAKLLRKL